jgi:choline dehydrogenase-like flavoprotein
MWLGISGSYSILFPWQILWETSVHRDWNMFLLMHPSLPGIAGLRRTVSASNFTPITLKGCLLTPHLDRSNFHPVGTASMLPRNKGGVVNGDLKVYGTKNVRVIDASVLPLQICGHLTSTLYAVAEKASDVIKRRYMF